MRTILMSWFFFGAALGCRDAIGPGGDCSREMAEVQDAEGFPESTAGPTQQGSNHVEIWRYPDVVYVFRWGPSYNGCVVETSALDRMIFHLT